MKIIGHLLNSEGPLFTILLSDKDGLITKIYSNRYNGNLVASTSFRNIVSYIESKLTLREFIENSISISFESRGDNSLQNIPLDTIQDSISYIDNYYNELSESLK